MRKLFVLVLLVAVVAAAGSYGYAWHQTRQQADRLAEALKPLADMQYGSVHVGIDGEAGIRDVTITPHVFADTVRIRSISVRAASLPALLGIGRELAEGGLPSELSLRVEGATLNLNGPLGDALMRMSEASSEPQTASLVGLLPADLEALGCGPVRHFGVRQLRAMGYTEISNDVRLGYRLDRDARSLTLSIAGDTSGVTAIEAELDFRLQQVPQRPAELMAAAPSLRRAKLEQVDLGFNRRKREYCARQAGTSAEAYVEDHLRRAGHWLARQRLNPGEGVMASYARLIEPSSRAELVIAPAEPLDPVQLAAFSPAQLLTVLQPQLSVNDEPAPLEELLDSSGVASAVAEAAEAAEVSQPQPPRFRPVAFGSGAQLKQHLYRDIRVVTQRGVDHEGRLIGVDGNVLAIEKRLRGGNMRFNVSLGEVKSLEVWH